MGMIKGLIKLYITVSVIHWMLERMRRRAGHHRHGY